MEGLTRVNALIVPQEAIMQGANGSYVYVLNGKNMVEMVNIHTGLMTREGGWIVDSGLKVGGSRYRQQSDEDSSRHDGASG